MISSINPLQSSPVSELSQNALSPASATDNKPDVDFLLGVRNALTRTWLQVLLLRTYLSSVCVNTYNAFASQMAR